MTPRFSQLALALVLASGSALAQAQATRMMMPEGTYDLVFGAGVGVTFAGGSEGTRKVIVPALSVQWSNGVFADVGVREAVLGLYLSNEPSLDYGVLASVSGRDQRSDTPGNRGGASLQGGGFLNWHPAHNIEFGSALQAGGGFDGGGLLAHLYARYGLRLASHHGSNVQVGMFLADQRWMQGYFGVTAAQGALGGVPAYRAGAGLVNIYGELGWDWQLSNKYSLNTGARLSRLAGPAGASPLIDQRARLSLRTALTYHF